MSEVSRADLFAWRNLKRNADANKGYWNPCRIGESVRVCPVCGREFEPHARMHKYCSEECRERSKECR